MAKFLNTKKAVSEIEDLIKEAGQTLILISPYLKFSNDFKEMLSYRNDKEKITTVICRESKLKADEMKFLESLRFVILKCKDEIHAKCYVNDDKIIITSLNFYDFSMINNKEMGVLIEKSNPHDQELFEDAFKEVVYINTTSKRFADKIQDVQQSAPMPIEKRNDKTTSNKQEVKLHLPNGYCIRTGGKIPFNIDKPLSHDAYKAWSKYSDEDYPEKFCHFSGEPSNGETSFAKPILKKNWKKAKEIFQLTDSTI